MADLLWQVPLAVVGVLGVLSIVVAHVGVALYVPWKVSALVRRDVRAYRWQRMNRAQRRQAMRG